MPETATIPLGTDLVVTTADDVVTATTAHSDVPVCPVYTHSPVTIATLAAMEVPPAKTATLCR